MGKESLERKDLKTIYEFMTILPIVKKRICDGKMHAILSSYTYRIDPRFGDINVQHVLEGTPKQFKNVDRVAIYRATEVGKTERYGRKAHFYFKARLLNKEEKWETERLEKELPLNPDETFSFVV